jgi:hypothetical protein
MEGGRSRAGGQRLWWAASTIVMVSVACLDAFADSQGGDRQGGYWVDPPPAHRRVQHESTEEHRRLPGAEEVSMESANMLRCPSAWPSTCGLNLILLAELEA